MKTSKAQMEIMGLAVIVILLAIGMFFVVKFAMPKKAAEAPTFQQRQVATGFVNTLLATNAGCGGSANFAKLIEDMAAPQYSLLTCGSLNTDLDDYFQTSVENILKETFDVWGYKYNFTVLFPPGTSADIVIDEACKGTTQQESAPPFPIPTDYGDVRVVMKICY